MQHVGEPTKAGCGRRGEHAAAKMLAEEALQKARELYHSLDEQVQLQALRHVVH